MKVTLAHDATYLTISDPNLSYSPDVLTDWMHRALETLTTFTVALAQTGTLDADADADSSDG